MKFGKNLEAGIEQKWQTWRSYALCYNEMKRLLPETNADENDIQEFKISHALENNTATSSRSDTFWKLYNDSIESLQRFYDKRVDKSTTKLIELQHQFEKLRSKSGSSFSPAGAGFGHGHEHNYLGDSGDDHADNSGNSNKIETIDHLLENFTQFQEETNLILEFLEINRTACRKILKKYDKRTQSSVKEERMSQLLETHGFLFGGGLMAGIKFKTDTILLKLKEMQVGTIDLDIIPASKSNDFNSLDKNAPTYDRLPEEYMKEAQFVLDEVSKSQLFSSNRLRQNAIFLRQEIEIGAFLGEGEYGAVHEIKSFHVKDTCPICFLHRRTHAAQEDSKVNASGEETSEAQQKNKNPIRQSSSLSTLQETKSKTSIDQIITFATTFQGDYKSKEDLYELEDDHVEEAEELVCSRGFMNEHCIRNGIARYALKEVKTSLKGRSLLNGAIDICIEAKFLSVLNHPNIIRLCGTSHVNPSNPQSFLILDRLYGTLGDKIESWRKKEKKYQKGFFGATRNKEKLTLLWNEQCLAMFDIARAMKYLHSHQIMYRDLKPENAGFDIYGNVKLFDFGLAKELQQKHRIGETDLYRASGRTGTRRYMSPENALCKPYGKSSDVYSFGILLWECLALKQPFEGMGIEQHAKLVVLGGKRPQIPKSWPVFIKLLVSESWAANRLDRPDFDEICSVLKGELTEREMNLSNRTNDLMNISITNRELHSHH